MTRNELAAVAHTMIEMQRNVTSKRIKWNQTQSGFYTLLKVRLICQPFPSGLGHQNILFSLK